MKRKVLIKINADVIEYEEEEEILLINMIKNQFHSLDSFSTLIWKKLKEFEESEKLINYLFENTSEEIKVIREDINDFISDLEKKGIVEIAS